MSGLFCVTYIEFHMVRAEQREKIFGLWIFFG